jgi:hypothetical protein
MTSLVIMFQNGAKVKHYYMNLISNTSLMPFRSSKAKVKLSNSVNNSVKATAEQY